ncbi:MAG: hypothetical protein ACNA77_03895 [Opitutales bacterium]
MIKKLLIGLVALALIAGVLIYFVGGSLLNSGIKKGVETFGPQVTQTSVTLESVNLSPFSGSGTLKGLNVGNPEGFKSENIFALGQIDIRVDTGTIFSDKIVIDEVIIQRPEMSYEKTMTSSNVQQLLDNIEAFTGPRDTSDPKPDEGAKKQVVIRKLVIEEGTVYVGAMGIGQTVRLPRIEMNDIGEDGNQITMAEAINLVLAKVMAGVGPALANIGELGKDAVNALRTQGLETIDQIRGTTGEAAKDTVNKAAEGIRSLFGD